MISQAYVNFCESLWSDWCAGRLKPLQGISDRFQLDHMPEPYLRFGDGNRPLYVLFTNPGRGMPHQCRDTVMAGESCVHPQMTYHEVSFVLAESYRGLPSGAARTRIEAMDDIRRLLGLDCIVQFESLPFHSKTLPRKDRIPQLVRETEAVREYIRVLVDAMKGVSVIALSAVASSHSISESSVRDSEWLGWQASLLAIDRTQLTLVPLVTKGDSITSAFLYQRVDGCTRGLVLTMGGNTFPAAQGRELLVHRLISSCC